MLLLLLLLLLLVVVVVGVALMMLLLQLIHCSVLRGESFYPARYRSWGRLQELCGPVGPDGAHARAG